MNIQVKHEKQFTGFTVWFVLVNGKKVSGPHVSEELAVNKMKRFMIAWNIEKIHKKGKVA